MISNKERLRREKISRSLKGQWKNRKIRSKRLKGLREAAADPVVRKRVSAGVRKYVDDPDVRAQRSKITTGLWSTSEYRDKVAKAVSRAKRKQWSDVGYHDKTAEAIRSSINHNRSGNYRRMCNRNRMTKSEALVFKLLKGNGFRYEFNGAQQGVVGRLTPDFIHRSKKMCIEVFGTIHARHLRRIRTCRLVLSDKDKSRLNEIRRNGWKVLVIWWRELEDPDKMIKKVRDFEKCSRR